MWVLRGLRDGVLTTRWPAKPDPYADSWATPPPDYRSKVGQFQQGYYAMTADIDRDASRGSSSASCSTNTGTSVADRIPPSSRS